MTRSIPVLRPQLPSGENLLPYLRRIDATRIYTNWGPLVCELEQRLSTLFGMHEGTAGVVSASSGTAALVGAVLASAGRATVERPLALVPAFTFVGTASAVEQCGYTPHLVDVDEESWMLDAATLAAHPLLSQAGLVVPVAPFGRAVSQRDWLAFQQQTGVPVVIDGAAAFEAVCDDPAGCIGRIPVAMSFHATKSFATGEGGCVLAGDLAMSRGVARALNFGFLGSRDSAAASSNGKMSEYHAAVGLAELDEWTSKRMALLSVADRYRDRMAAAGLANRLVISPSIASCYVLFRCLDRSESLRVQQALADADIGFRMWYGDGLLKHRYFANLGHDPLPVTESVAGCTIGLPVAVDLTRLEIDRIIVALQPSMAAAGYSNSPSR